VGANNLGGRLKSDGRRFMQQYRLTKYDPAFRDKNGAYQRDEWTFFAQVGSCVGGEVLTLEKYEATEAAYIRVVCSLVETASIGPFVVSDIEGTPAGIEEGQRISQSTLPRVLRSLLREEYWCRLTDEKGHFIHAGWDFYLYLGLPNSLIRPELVASAEGLYLEPFQSPYLPSTAMNEYEFAHTLSSMLAELGAENAEPYVRRATKECRDAVYADTVAHGGEIGDPFFNFVVFGSVAVFTFFESDFSIYALHCNEAQLISEMDRFALADTAECKTYLAATYQKLQPDLVVSRSVCERWLEG
jgi:hypothetical protein